MYSIAGARLIAEGILDLLGDPLPQAVGGMAIGADPITAAVITLAGVQNLPLKGFLVRKQAKGHGTNRFVEGPVQAGDEVVIVEDVVTTGGAQALGLEGHGLDRGCGGDIVLVQAETVAEAVAHRPGRRTVVKRGRIVARDGVTLL